jgi:tetratricopeptide (TPR) repeat protein
VFLSRTAPALILALVCGGAAACGQSAAERRQIAYERGNQHFDRGEYREAAIEYRRSLQQDGRFADARRRLAETYLKLEQPGNALREYVNAADLLPADVDVQLKAASLLLLAGDHEGCRKRAEQVLKEHPDNVDALLLAGSSAAGLKDLDGALRDVQRAIAVDPAHGRAYANLAFVQLRRGRQDEAEQAFARAQALAPESVEVQLAIANYHWASGRAAEAEADLRKALASTPKDPRVNQTLATFYLSSGQVAAAEPFLKAVAELSRSPEPSLALADYYVMTGKIDRAVTVLARLEAERRVYVEAAARLAVIKHGQGQTAEAQAALDALLQKEPGNARLLLLKGRLLFEEGHPDAALERVNAAVQAEPRSAAAKYLLGVILLAKQDKTGAIRTFNEVLSLAPNAVDPLLQLSHLYLAAHDTRNAAQMAEQAVKADGGNAAARLALARALIARGELRGAVTHAERAVALAPASADAQALLGTALALKGDRPAARLAITRALAAERTNIDAIGARLALDLADGRRAEAQQFLDAYEPARQKNVPLLLVIASGYDRLGQAAASEAALRRAIEVDPSNPIAYSRLGGLYAAAGRLAEARREFEIACAKEPESIPAHTMVAVLDHMRGDLRAARAAYEKVLAISATAPVAANNLAWLYAEEGNLDRALELARTAKQALPDRAEVSDTLGWVYYRKNLHDLAAAAFKESVEQDPANPVYHYHLGLAYARLGSLVPARKALERALALSDSFDGAADARALAQSLAAR